MVAAVSRHSGRRERHRRIVARSHPPCHLCGADIDYSAGYLDPESFTIDHIIPIARGGADHIDNIAAAHRKCNRAKSDGPAVIRQAIKFITPRRWS